MYGECYFLLEFVVGIKDKLMEIYIDMIIGD